MTNLNYNAGLCLCFIVCAVNARICHNEQESVLIPFQNLKLGNCLAPGFIAHCSSFEHTSMALVTICDKDGSMLVSRLSS